MKAIAVLAVGVAASIVGATAANAVVTTFATFSASSSARNIRWVNSGVKSNNSASNTSTGTGGYFYSTTTATSVIPGKVLVNFEFLLTDLVPIAGIVPADFFMNVVESPPSSAIKAGTIYIQNVLTGGFNFTSKTVITVGSTSYAIGSNLLTGTFLNSTIVGAGTSGRFSGSTITYTSDFLDFGLTNNRDFAMSLTSITGALFATSTKSLRTFRAIAGGSFSADPAPRAIGVPEPQVWAMMLAGFGLVGVQVRRRVRQSVSVA